VLIFFISVLGWTVARTPEVVLRVISAVFGELILALPSRRRLVNANLANAFPGRSAAWRARIAHQSARRLVETALLAVASPHFPPERIRRVASLSPGVIDLVRAHHANPGPLVLPTAHFAHWETLVWLPMLSPVPFGEAGVIYRPLKSPALDAYIHRTRERFGLRLLSRKGGLQSAHCILGRNGVVSILFDQNAGNTGALTLLFDRVCSTTELPGLLAEKHQAGLHVVYPLRTGFWKVEFQRADIPHDGTMAGGTLGLNRWLETALSTDDRLCSSWLWSHARWKVQNSPDRRLNLDIRRSLLGAEIRSRGLVGLPRRTRYFVRLPNWLGDVVMLLPILRAMRDGRPDVEFTLIGKAAFEPLLAASGLADRYEPLPAGGRGYFWSFRRFRMPPPECCFIFTHSLRGDLEAWMTGARLRFGIVRPGHRRPLLSHAHVLPAGFDAACHHQFEQWEAFARAFGLTVSPIDRAPLPVPAGAPPRGRAIGLIAGSENNPGKRWPVAHWRTLIEECPDREFKLFGTANDRPITDQIAAGFDPQRVQNLAGATDLEVFMNELRTCALIIANDTGGMHLANALGTPVIALFGPTNPVRTGPVYSSPVTILQPPGCAPRGGGRQIDLAPETVKAVLLGLKR
jgi:heptosyltransferase II